MKTTSRSRLFLPFACLFCLFALSTAHPAGKSGKRGDFDIAAGDIKITLHKETGTFSLYKLRDTGKNRYDPLLDTRNYGASTCFAISVNGKVYPLEKKAFKETRFEASDDGKEAFFLFTSSDDFHVAMRFYIEENSVFGPSAFVLAIETSVENTSDKSLFVAWRALFDTMLGEGRSSSVAGHFLTDSGQAISHETQLVPSSVRPKALFSSSGDRTCAISLLDVEGQPALNSVYIANWTRCDSLLRSSFSRPIGCVEGRSLSSVYAPNDSAVLMSWKETCVEGGEAASVTVFLSALEPQAITEAAITATTAAAAAVIIEAPLVEAPPVEAEPQETASSASEKQTLFLMVLNRLNQIESGEAIAGPSEIAELNRILDFLLENPE